MKDSKKARSLINEKTGQSLDREFYSQIRDVIQNARNKVYKSVNFIMVESYWNMGLLIFEEEQRGKKRADYGEHMLSSLAERLTEEFGSGYSLTNLKYFRGFYVAFPIGHALRDQLARKGHAMSDQFAISHELRSELFWTHYRLLLRVEDKAAREWYMNEAADQNWSTRQLDRQINSFYYERLLASKDKKPVIKEAEEKLAEFEPEEFIRDPYVLEFLNLKDYPGLR